MPSSDRLKAIRAIVAIYRDFEQESRKGDMSMAHYRLMLYLQNGPKRAGEIAAAGEIAKPTVSLALNALREKGWLENVADPDGRATAVVTTTAGRERMRRFERQLSATLGSLLDGESTDALCTLLADIYAVVIQTKEERLKDVERLLRG